MINQANLEQLLRNIKQLPEISPDPVFKREAKMRLITRISRPRLLTTKDKVRGWFVRQSRLAAAGIITALTADKLDSRVNQGDSLLLEIEHKEDKKPDQVRPDNSLPKNEVVTPQVSPTNQPKLDIEKKPEVKQKENQPKKDKSDTSSHKAQGKSK